MVLVRSVLELLVMGLRLSLMEVLVMNLTVLELLLLDMFGTVGIGAVGWSISLIL